MPKLKEIGVDIKTTTKDLGRLRKYLEAAAEKSLGGDGRLIGRVLTTEDKLTALRTRQRAGKAAVAKARAALIDALESLASTGD